MFHVESGHDCSTTFTADEVMELVTELKRLRLDPLTYDGENTDEVDNFTEGYNAALEDMRDIIRKYFPT